MQKFDRLFEPGHIGSMMIKNRLVMPAMGTRYALDKGYVSQRQIDYYEARGRGGVGLIITEITAPCFSGRNGSNQLTISDDSYILGFRALAEAIHKHGAKIAVQLHHSGREVNTAQTGYPAVGPSAVPTITGAVPQELTTSEIADIVKQFAEGARRAKEAGIDGVEIHCAHHYLLATFVSRATNKRTDQYGGSIENRARFTLEIVKAVREVVGRDFPVWVRINGQEPGINDGVTIEEAYQVAKLVEEAGADAVHVSAFGAGIYASKAPLPDTPGYLLPLAYGVKQAVNIPVIAVGRMDPFLAEQAIKAGKADFVAMGRRLLADPELPNKAASGRLDDINPCIGCMECLQRGVITGGYLSCTVNPTMGKEQEYRIEKAKSQQRVIVIGGGPAGLETARVAALRGHRVSLIEKSSKLGGLLHLAAVPPHKQEICGLIEYLDRQVRSVGVDIRLNTEATVNSILKENADIVIVATGGIPYRPDIGGIKSPNVVNAEDVLSGKNETGQNIVIIGGGIVGCETGNYLAEKGKNVTILEVLSRLAGELSAMLRYRLLHELKEKHAVMLTNIACESIDENGVAVTDSKGQKRIIPADTVVVAAGYATNMRLADDLKDKVPEVHCIGDAAKAGQIYDAILAGCQVGLSL